MGKITDTNLGGNTTHFALLLFRVAVGVLILTHGIPKLMKVASGTEIQFVDAFGLGMATTFVLAMLSEFVGGILVILGLGTRLATIPLMITMLGAVFLAHGADPFSVKEKPLLFFVCFAFLCIVGSGRLSLDRLFAKR